MDDDTNSLVPLDPKESNRRRKIDIFEIMRNNPELPDILRDMADYAPKSMRMRLVRAAGAADALFSLDPQRYNEYPFTERPKEELYSVMKKYIPSDKRDAIDGMMAFAGNFRERMAPRSDGNKLDKLINDLTRINEITKLANGAETVMEFSKAARKEKNSKPDIDSVLKIIGGMVGKEKSQKLRGIIEGFGTVNIK